MSIKSFRGNLKDGEIQELNLRTNNGKTGYRIVKLELFPAKFGYFDQKSTVTISTTEPAAASSLVNFSDADLLGASCISTDNSEANPLNLTSVFDHVKFNQNIWIAHNDAHGDQNAVNYYLELETMTLSDNETTVATLQSLRSRYEAAYYPAGPS
tara:strand:+ start:57 stop:521 length:465 start_codon:yes stop_codon:yes gene_type:complete